MATPTSPSSTVNRKTLETVHRLLAEAVIAGDSDDGITDPAAAPEPGPLAGEKLLPRRARGR